jgi:hypothetical protein
MTRCVYGRPLPVVRVKFVPVLLLAAFFCAVRAATSASLEWHAAKGCLWAAVEVKPSRKIGFTRLGAEVHNIHFSNDVSEEESFTRIVIGGGSGVALGDVDNDGLCDIFMASLKPPCRLFKNLGNWRFKDISESTGLGPIAADGWYGKGCCFADLNGDGNLDLIVTLFCAEPNVAKGGIRCWLGNGTGEFREITNGSGLESNAASHTVALADVDGDGDLDLYVANYRDLTIRDSNVGLTGTGPDGTQYRIHRSYDYRGRLLEDLRFPVVFGRATVPPNLRDRFWVDGKGVVHELGLPDQLYLNDGKAKFTPVSWTGGAFRDEDGKPLTAPPRDYGLTVTFRDFNGDGAPDFYVCNDFETPDRLWFGDGRGGFEAAPRLALRTISMSSMGVDVGDLNRDGKADFYVVDMLARTHERQKRQTSTITPLPLAIGMIDNRAEVMRNTLYLNRGDATWAEIGSMAGVGATDWSWQPLFLDIDLDGWEDIFVTNGFERNTFDSDAAAAVQALGVITPKQRLQAQKLYEKVAPPKVAFRNRGDLTFEEVAAKWGLDTPGIAHGVAEADLDNDGDLDLVVNMYREPVAIYRNETIAPRVAVRLRGSGGNSQGIGAKVTLRGGAVPVQSREMFCGGRYLSGGDPMLVFAAGAAKSGMTIEVLWRNGRRSLVEDVRPNRIYAIFENEE